MCGEARCERGCDACIQAGDGVQRDLRAVEDRCQFVWDVWEECGDKWALGDEGGEGYGRTIGGAVSDLISAADEGYEVD